MNTRLWRYLTGAAAITILAACATVRQDPGGPLDGPLPPGTYELEGNVTYRADSNLRAHEAHSSFRTRLYVSVDGTTELYSGQYECADPRTLPGYRPRREWEGGNPGHHFSCGDSDWTLWANHDGKLFGRMSTTVTESVATGRKCIMWEYGSGRPVCHEYGYEVSSRRTTVTSDATVKRVGG
ncbi:MAG: hypothetical protein LJF04_00930 [Gemmatimonadetes bacterium]|nr:hypothetical protein [Gemmatimonadota bacterium]